MRTEEHNWNGQKVWSKTTTHLQHAFLEYNLMGNNAENIFNIYLQHHPIKVNI